MNLPATFRSGASHVPLNEDIATFQNGRRIKDASGSLEYSYFLQDEKTDSDCRFSMHQDQEGVIRTTIQTMYHRNDGSAAFLQKVDCETTCSQYPWEKDIRRNWTSLTISDGGSGYKDYGASRPLLSWHRNYNTPLFNEGELFAGLPIDDAFSITAAFIEHSVTRFFEDHEFPNFETLNPNFGTHFLRPEILLAHDPQAGQLDLIEADYN